MQNVHIMSEVEVCESALSVGFVKFVYLKVNGERRVAIGTRNMSVVDKIGCTPDGGDRRERNPNICTYFDLVKGEWRSFRRELFETMLFDKMSMEEACSRAMLMAINDNDCRIDNVANNIAKLLGDSAMRDLVNLVCDRRDWDEDRFVNETLCDVFDYTPTSTTTDACHSVQSTQMSKTRAELLDELMRLRERETEILVELLGAR